MKKDIWRAAIEIGFIIFLFYHVSRVRQGVVHHGRVVPRGRRQDSPVICVRRSFLKG
jgi:hypothetical protein